MRKIAIILTFLVFSITAYSQTTYKSYGNARFGYTIYYPSDLIAQGEADNGDGQIFKNDDAKLTVFGSNMLASGTLLKEFNQTIKDRSSENVTYKLSRPTYFVVSGKANDRIFYQKTIRKANDSYVTFIFEYAESKRGVYDQATMRIAKSFK